MPLGAESPELFWPLTSSTGPSGNIFELHIQVGLVGRLGSAIEIVQLGALVEGDGLILQQVAVIVVNVVDLVFLLVSAEVSVDVVAENVKIILDVIYIVLSAVICLVFLGELKGVREGSIIAAIAVGLIIKLYNKGYTILARKFKGDDHS